MRLLWTYSDLPMSPVIKWLMHSQSSHFCVEFFGTFILQANFQGLGFVRTSDFMQHNHIVFEKKIPLNIDKQASLFSHILIEYWGAKYDFKWFFNLGKAAFLSKIFKIPMPQDVKWQSRAKFLCIKVAKVLEPTIGPVNIDSGNPDKLWEQLKDREILGDIA